MALKLATMLQPTGRTEKLVPEPLESAHETASPYPLAVLPRLLRDAAEGIADFVQGPPALAGHTVLGAAACLAQSRVDSWSHVSRQMPCSLFSLALGSTGSAKSSTHRLAFLPIEQAEKQRLTLAGDQAVGANGLVTGDASFSRVTSMLVEGCASLFWTTAEGGQLLKGHSLQADNAVAVLGAITRLWDDGGLERIRSKSNADASGIVFNRRLSLSLMVQEITIRDVLRDPVMRGQGFLARFLFCAPDNLLGTRTLSLERLSRKAEDDLRIAHYWERLEELMLTPEAVDPQRLGEVAAPALIPTSDAKKLWLEFYNANELKLGRFGDHEPVAEFAIRAPQQALRLATVLAFFEGKSQVDEEAMYAAVCLAEHSTQEWHRYTVATFDPALEAARDISDWLVAKVRAGEEKWLEFTGRQWLQCGYGRYRTARKRDQAFRLLLERKHLLETPDGYRLNPLLLENSAEGGGEGI